MVELGGEAARLRAQLAGLARAGRSDEAAATLRQLEGTEAELGRVSRAYKDHLRVRTADLGRCAPSAADSGLLELRQYRPSTSRPGSPAPRWAGLLLVGFEEPVLVDLGPVRHRAAAGPARGRREEPRRRPPALSAVRPARRAAGLAAAALPGARRRARPGPVRRAAAARRPALARAPGGPAAADRPRPAASRPRRLRATASSRWVASTSTARPRWQRWSPPRPRPSTARPSCSPPSRTGSATPGRTASGHCRAAATRPRTWPNGTNVCARTSACSCGGA